MSLLLNESFLINNFISISNKIKNISFFFIYFNCIESFKNLDKNREIIPLTTSNNIISKIKYKLIKLNQSNITPYNFNNNFPKSLYHVFIASYLLEQNSLCFIIYNNPFILSSNLPILNDFSYSFNFKKINYSNLKSYFSPYFLSNPFIPIDIFVISFLINNNISKLDQQTLNIIIDQYRLGREKIEIYSILSILQYLNNYSTLQIIKYLLQFKYTWSNYCLCFYFILNYSNLLKEHLLYDEFNKYIQSHPKERNKNIINIINNILFII